MGVSDHEFVNFSEDYELNYHLKKVDKRQTKSNRAILKDMGQELKDKLNKTMLRHDEFAPYVEEQKERLD